MNVIGGDMLDAARAMPDHLRDALWRIESARAATMEAPAAFLCGMGGSAIGGDLAIAALSDRLTKPMVVARGYELPAWAPAGSAVLCSSYSGNTEETLACYAAAEALGTASRDDEALTLQVPSDGSLKSLRALLDRLDYAAIEVGSLSIHTPDLDDVFFALTGHPSTGKEVQP